MRRRAPPQRGKRRTTTSFGIWALDWRANLPNAIRYIFFFGNLDHDGPVVFELPGGVPGAGFLGTFSDAWWEPLSDLGVAGPDEGKGGKYLVLPADYDGEVPSGYIPVRSRTSNYFMGLRSILEAQTAENVQAGNALVEQIRVYPLSEAASPPQQRLIDMTGVMFEALPRYDATFYTTLASILNEEPVQERDKVMMGMLLALGIKKGEEFQPSDELTGALDAAAKEANAWFVDGLVRTSQTYWPDRRWVFPMPAIAAPERPETPHWAPQFKWEVDDYFDADSRAIALASFFCPPVELGLRLYYLGAFDDADGQPLNGDHTYRLHVPADVPVQQFWSITVYSKETAALFRESTHVALGSVSPGLQRTTTAPSTSTSAPKRPPGTNRTGSRHRPAAAGGRGSASSDLRRPCSTRPGSCQTSRS